MGERSNIFVRIRAKKSSSDKNYKLKTFFGLYYQWCYGERMISRLSSAIDFVENNISGWYGEHVVSKNTIDKFKRYLAINFDMRDILEPVDLIKELSNDVMDGYADTNSDIFNQDENHGFIYIDISIDDLNIKKAKIKYAFVDNEYKRADGTVPPVRSVEDFADHDIGEDRRKWYEPTTYWDEHGMTARKESFLTEIVPTCKKNIDKINSSATLMSEDDRKDFVKFGRSFTKYILNEVEKKKKENNETRTALIDYLKKIAGESCADDNYSKLLNLIQTTYTYKKTIQ